MRGFHVATMLATVAILALALPQTAVSCAPQGVDTIAKVGDKTYVCLVVNSKRVTLFMPKADEYTRITLQGSFNSTSFDTETLTSPSSGECTTSTVFNTNEPKACKYSVVHVESMGKRSLAKAYKVYHHDSNTPKWSSGN